MLWLLRQADACRRGITRHPRFVEISGATILCLESGKGQGLRRRHHAVGAGRRGRPAGRLYGAYAQDRRQARTGAGRPEGEEVEGGGASGGLALMGRRRPACPSGRTAWRTSSPPWQAACAAGQDARHGRSPLRRGPQSSGGQTNSPLGTGLPWLPAKQRSNNFPSVEAGQAICRTPGMDESLNGVSVPHPGLSAVLLFLSAPQAGTASEAPAP